MEKACVKKNFLWVDYTKFIAIYFMIVGHLLDKGSHFYNLMYLFHMPLFFILSGYLYNQKSKMENYLKIFWGLLIPYLLYQFLFLPIRIIDLYFMEGANIINSFFACLKGIFQAATISNPTYIIVCGPCWFIMVMMQLRFIFNFVGINNKSIVTLIFLSIIISKYLICKNILLICCLNCTLIAIPYFSLGLLLRFNNINYEKFNSKIFVFLFTITGVFFLNLLLKYNGLIKISRPLEHTSLHPSLLVMYLGGIIGSYMLILFSCLKKRYLGFIDCISKNTLFIIFAQEVCIFILKLLKFSQYIDNINITLLKFLFICCLGFIILFICYIFIKFFEKYFPIILGKR